jgi:hypothetical protein
MATAVINKILAIQKIEMKFSLTSMIDRAMDIIGLREIRIQQGKAKLPTTDQPQRADAISGPKGTTPEHPDAPSTKLWMPAWGDEKVLDYVSTVGRKNLCYDDRDRVYALISLRSDHDVRIEPDYGKNMEEVYADFARQCLARQDVRILHHSGLSLRSMASAEDSRSSTFEFPSWAPDWRVDRAIKFGGGNKQLYTAGLSLKVLIRTEKQNPSIDVAKVFIDVVEVRQNLAIEGFESSRPLDFSFEPSRKSILGLREFFDSHRDSERYSNGEMSLTAFARTVVADLAPNGMGILKSLLKDSQNTQEMVNLWLLFEKISIKMNGSPDLDQQTMLPDLASLASYSGQQIVRIAWIYMTSLSALLKKPQFFITRKKYIGPAPAMTQAGDLIALIGGCQAPFVLRPDHERKIFRIVGDCYLHGFMNGELLTDAHPGLTFKIY